MNNHDAVNEILVRLFANILDIEEKCLKIGEFSDLSISEMHVIENIGINRERTMSDTAKDLRITSGTLTTAVDNLIRKGYVERKRSIEDRRVVIIKLTEKGVAAYSAHEDFHKDMVISALQQLDTKEEELLIKILTDIDVFFKQKYDIGYK
ncbi:MULTISPECIES: MarR family winged helix-turn-helix transcriptional regulator [Sedimentibacter]|uniref:HTH-type transcriptional regulator SarZ n=1 Tax=Sedimentibacter hydroxybenzoicus DSM 7310 TaxID=1123245 RepID=A0A974BN43_SEDHY|nr:MULTISPECIES: MarR family winged helix-turn-helix transcriptional regulator [Sedimentibacter]NYB75797.1 winged helix-turn-helix transcriptional regulator [Sedimentibacter hydroxybenzoicus DSM 7310]HCX62234.1 MarR family transcriptional regulator [Clostridiales bacterium]